METSKRPTLAVALIVKNEAENLHDCLASVVGWVDEIVVLDSGSTDTTLNIAQTFNARIFINTDWQGFGKQRQLAQSYVQSEWVLWLDADERVTPELRAEIQWQLQNSLSANTVFAIPRLSWAFGRFIRHSGWYPDYVLRFYPKDLTHYDDSLVHEKVIILSNTAIKRLQNHITHYPYRDIQHYFIKTSGYLSSWAQQKHAQGKTTTLLQAFTHSLACFIRMYIFKAGILDGSQGFILATIGTYTTFIKYVELWIISAKQFKTKPNE